MEPAFVNEHQPPAGIEAARQPSPKTPGFLVAFYGYCGLFLSGPPAPTGRPRCHGPKMKCKKDPGTWPKPSTEYTCKDAGYGAVRVRAWANLHLKVRAYEGQGSRGPLPIVRGTLVLMVEVERLARCGERRREPRVLWLVVGRHRGNGSGSGLAMARLRQTLPPGTHLPLPQADVRMDQPPVVPPRASGSVDVAGGGSLHAVAPVASERWGYEAAVGEALRRGTADADAGSPSSFDLLGQVGTPTKPP